MNNTPETPDKSGARSPRQAKMLTFEDLWRKGPTLFLLSPGVSPEDQRRIAWHYHIMLLARIRPFPDYVRENPAFLAEPLARETGMPLKACLMIVENLMAKTEGQLRREGISAAWALRPTAVRARRRE